MLGVECIGVGVCTDQIKGYKEFEQRITGTSVCEESSVLDYFEMICNSVQNAVNDADDILKSTAKNRKGFILCSSLGNVDELKDFEKFWKIELEYVEEVKRKFELNGIGTVVTNTCISGANGISTAMEYISAGLLDVCVVCGADLKSRFISQSFASCQIESEQKQFQAFAKDANGIVLGNGAGAIVLCDRKRVVGNCKKYGLIAGYSITNDAFRLMTPDREAKEMKRAIDSVLKKTNTEVKDIDCVFTGANGTRLNDGMYATVFRDRLKDCEISSIKHLVNHTLGASMIIEIIGIFACMKNQIIPGIEVDVDDDFKDLPIVGRSKKKCLNSVLLIGNGFSGGNAAIVVRKV